MVKKKDKPKIAYLSYPFSKDPIGYTKEACSLAKEIMKKHADIFIIVPHSAVDYTLFGEPKDISGYKDTDHLLAPQLEFTILWNIDIFIRGKPLDSKVSIGCIWEEAFVRWLNIWRDKKIKITTPEELMK